MSFRWGWTESVQCAAWMRLTCCVNAMSVEESQQAAVCSRSWGLDIDSNRDRESSQQPPLSVWTPSRARPGSPGTAQSSSSSPCSASVWDWATSGGSPTSASRMEEVRRWGWRNPVSACNTPYSKNTSPQHRRHDNYRCVWYLFWMCRKYLSWKIEVFDP